MAIRYNENVIGKIVITQNERDYELEVRQGNCLAVIIHVSKDEDGTYNHTLMDFFADATHLTRRCKAVDNGEEKNVLFYDVKSIRLNMRYKECEHILKRLVKYYEINCYYE